MKFGKIITELLLEISGDDAYVKYYKDIPKRIYNQIVLSDPGTKSENGQIMRMGPYSKLLLHLFRKKSLLIEDLPKVTEYLSLVYKYNVPLSFQTIHSVNDIYNAVNKYIAKESSDVYEYLKLLPQNEYKILLNGKKWDAIRPLTEKAACYLGVNSEWCTAWGEYSTNPSYRSRRNRFPGYSKMGDLVVIINKENPEEKYQFHFESNQFMNLQDRRINVTDLLYQNDELKYFFFPSLIKDVDESIESEELSRIGMLYKRDRILLLEKNFSKIAKIPLVDAIIYEDTDEIKKYIVDQNILDIDFLNGSISFELQKFGPDLRNLEDVISYIHADSEYSYDTASGGMEFTDRDFIEYLTDIFKEYYAFNKEKLNKIGYSSVDDFSKQFLYDFVNSSDIREKFVDVYTDDVATDMAEAANADMSSIEKNIILGENTAIIPSAVFLKFLEYTEITTIRDIDDVLSQYLDYVDAPTDYYESSYDYSTPMPGYKHPDLKKSIDEYFSKFFVRPTKVLDDEDLDEECEEYVKKFDKIFNDLFKGRNVYENENIKIRLAHLYPNCEDGTISIYYQNKKTGETYVGKVKLDNLSTYALNYQLFEEYLLFRNIIF